MDLETDTDLISYCKFVFCLCCINMGRSPNVFVNELWIYIFYVHAKNTAVRFGTRSIEDTHLCRYEIKSYNL